MAPDPGTRSAGTSMAALYDGSKLAQSLKAKFLCINAVVAATAAAGTYNLTWAEMAKHFPSLESLRAQCIDVADDLAAPHELSEARKEKATVPFTPADMGIKPPALPTS